MRTLSCDAIALALLDRRVLTVNVWVILILLEPVQSSLSSLKGD
jgi:hypothetical protein